MRNKERIPIVLEFFRENELAFNRFLNQKVVISNFEFELLNEEFEKYWLENYDLRLGQALINFGSIEDSMSLFFKEEVDWLIDNKYLNVEDISFWGINFNKDNTRKEKTEFKLLKDLETDHIINIKKFFKGRIKSLNKDYLKYFNKRIKEYNG